MKTSPRIGIVILALLSLGNVPSVLTTDGEHPPVAIAAVLTVIGIAGLVLSVFAWAGKRPSLIALIALQTVSALSAAPAFTVEGVPTGLRMIAAVMIAITAIGIALVVPALRGLPAARGSDPSAHKRRIPAELIRGTGFVRQPGDGSHAGPADRAEPFLKVVPREMNRPNGSRCLAVVVANVTKRTLQIVYENVCVSLCTVDRPRRRILFRSPISDSRGSNYQ